MGLKRPLLELVPFLGWLFGKAKGRPPFLGSLLVLTHAYVFEEIKLGSVWVTIQAAEAVVLFVSYIPGL